MGWTSGYYVFQGNTDIGEIMTVIKDSLDQNRGAMPPVHLEITFPATEHLFDSEEAAEQYISEECGKYFRKKNVAVYFKEAVAPVKENAKIKDLSKRINETHKKLNSYRDNHSVSNRDSQYIGCKSCGSKINRNYIARNECPVCGITLLSATVLNQIAYYQEKISHLNKQLELEKKKEEEKAMRAKYTTKILVYASAYLG